MMSVPSQSQSSPIIHFANNVRFSDNLPDLFISSPSISIDSNEENHFNALLNRPQSTPISCPELSCCSSTKSIPKNQNNSNPSYLRKDLKRKHVTTHDYSTLTKIPSLNPIHNQMSSRILLEVFNKNNISDRDEIHEHLLRPPPLLVLSQSIRAKYPEKLIDSKLNHRISSTKDLPHSPANFSFFFHDFTQTQLHEAKRLTRRMGNCFTSETLDFVTTHFILYDDTPTMKITLDLILAMIYRCRLVTFSWLKSSSNIGEWLCEKKFSPKKFLKTYPSLDIYRKSRQRLQSLNLFGQFGSIYVTSTVEQRPLLVKLIHLLGGDITVNRDRATLIIGKSSKILPVIIYPQLHENWIIDSILAGKCLSIDRYLLDKPIQSQLNKIDPPVY